jgi:hypothetical protein
VNRIGWRSAGAACATGVAVSAAALAGPLMTSQPPGDTDASSSTPLTVSTLESTVLEAMREALLSRIPDAAQGKVETVALGDDWKVVAPGERSAATAALTSSKVGESREWSLYVAARGAEGDAIEGCPTNKVPAMLTCSAASTSDGTETTETFVSIVYPEAGPGKYAPIESATITHEMLPNLRVERIVRLHLNGGGYVSVRETLYGVDSMAFDAELGPADELVRAAHDAGLLGALDQSSPGAAQ